MNPRGRVTAIERIGFTVADLGLTESFYGRLGFIRIGKERVGADELALLGVPESRAERLVMKLGRQHADFLRFAPPGRPYPAGSTSTDLWFQHIAIAVGDMADAGRRLAAAPFTSITEDGPQHLPENTGGVTAFKFPDPDGHPLELLHFPLGTGDPAWQCRDPATPFLGIDHTAIAVSDVARSQRFYEDLGLRRAARSLNRGPEQQRLDDVAADVVDVVVLEPERKTPHLELLGYRTGTRRPMPAEAAARPRRTCVGDDAGPMRGMKSCRAFCCRPVREEPFSARASSLASPLPAGFGCWSGRTSVDRPEHWPLWLANL